MPCRREEELMTGMAGMRVACGGQGCRDRCRQIQGPARTDDMQLGTVLEVSARWLSRKCKQICRENGQGKPHQAGADLRLYLLCM
jgi:hypothetical protein